MKFYTLILFPIMFLQTPSEHSTRHYAPIPRQGGGDRRHEEHPERPFPHATRHYAPIPVGQKLYYLVSSGDFIAVGRITGISAVVKRLTAEERKSMKDLGEDYGGEVYTFHVEALLCARTDLQPGVLRPKIDERDLYIFQSADEEMMVNQAHYQVGQRYLMVFVPMTNQERSHKKYMLKADVIYYEAFEETFELERGLVPLTDANLPWFNKFSTFCQALAPLGREQKLRLLRPLSTSSDYALSESARRAIAHIESKQ